MPERKQQSATEQVALAVLVCAAVGAFGSSYRTPAWVLLLPCVLLPFWRIRRLPGMPATGIRYLAYVWLGGAAVLGLIFMAYPVLSGQTATLLTLLAGYGLALFSVLFLLGMPVWPPASTLFPAALGTLVVACFSPVAPVQGLVALAGAAVFAWLALQRSQEETRGKPPAGAVRAAARLAACAALALLLAWTIIRFLPWAQAGVEQATVTFFAGQYTSYRSFNSDSQLGDLEELKLSSKVVMRVWTDRPQKLRGRVFTVFDGRAWHANATLINTSGGGRRVVTLGSGLLQPEGARVSLSPAVDDWLRAVPGNDFVVPQQEQDAPGTAGARYIRTRMVQKIFNGGMLVAPGAAVLVRAPLPALRVDLFRVFRPALESATEMYGVISRGSRGVAQPGESPDYMLDLALEVASPDPRLKESAARLGAGAVSVEERIERTVSFVQNQCRYSLKPGKFRTRDPVAEFLFEKQQGYCEYFASAAAVLLRLQGVPCRYVTGFSVQEMNRVAGHYLVREKDAHAWIEAYVPGKGWLEADPTPEAEYRALHAESKDGWLANAGEWLQAFLAETLAQIRSGDWKAVLRWGWLKLKALFGWFLVARFWLALLCAALLVAAAGLIRRLLRNRVTDWAGRPATHTTALGPELGDLLNRLDRRWAALGFARPACRAPLEHLDSIPPEKIPVEMRAASRAAVEYFYLVSFGGAPPDSGQLRQLKRAL